ncbi:Hypothetical predicted protein, partial [Olea europaea subsp. europaea]
MASLIAKLWHKLQGRKAPVSVMLIGLDNSGKTSILTNLVACQWRSSQAPGGPSQASSKRSPARAAQASSPPPTDPRSPTGAIGPGLPDDPLESAGGLLPASNGWTQATSGEPAHHHQSSEQKGQRPAPTIG